MDIQATDQLPRQSQATLDNESNKGGRFWPSLARAFAGAAIFSISLFMTMEMWTLGGHLNQFRLALFLVVNMILLVGLARVRGFKQNVEWLGSAIDAFVGFAVGLVASGLFLYLFAAIDLSMSWNEIVGKLALQAVPGGIGALLARSQLGHNSQAQQAEVETGASFGREIFLMLAGALFISFTVAPTDEIVVIAYTIGPWTALGLLLLSIAVMHAMVYTVNFRGQHKISGESTAWGVFLHYSVTGYALVLLTSLYMLWTFGRLEGIGVYPVIMTVIVLSVPGALGAAAARLIL